MNMLPIRHVCLAYALHTFREMLSLIFFFDFSVGQLTGYISNMSARYSVTGP